MNKSAGVIHDSQLGRMKLMGIISLQLMTIVIIIAAAYLAFVPFRADLENQTEEDLLAVSELKPTRSPITSVSAWGTPSFSSNDLPYGPYWIPRPG